MSETDLCRLCAETKDNFIGIYDPQGQKLGIESKIYKCLRIQVILTDNLPSSICIDCCIQLDQCYKFYEKSNEAQNSLRQLFSSGTKNEIVGQILDSGDLNFVEKAMGFTKEEEEGIHAAAEEEGEVGDENEEHEGLVECHLSDNYINNVEAVDNSVGYFNDTQQQTQQNINIESENDLVRKFNTNDREYDSGMADGTIKVESNCRMNDADINTSSTRKNSSSSSNNKQTANTRKRLKRRNETQKIEDIELALNSDLEDDLNELDHKVNVKIPDNYMTGTDSDIEMIEARAAEPSKPGRKRGEGLDRYPWLCTDCNDKLPSLEFLEEHHETVHNQKAKFMCVQCCKVYDKYYGFLTHVKRHKNKSKFSCEDCGKSFVHKKVLDSHKAIHSEERPHICQTCGKSFRQQSALYIHSRCHLPDTMKNRYQCDQCDKRFSTKPNLVTHKRIHSGVRNFTCDQCGKSFIQKGNLEAHFLTHSADKPFNCSQCPKAFKTPLQLKKHETVHTGAKPHQCAVCGRTFREKGTLREHHRIHTGAMPFTCEFCGKCFRFKGILTTHRRQHTGERPYSCLECQHHFTNWPNYNKHMKRRHGINTSHTKHLQQPQHQNQQQQDNLQEDPLAIVQQQHQQQQQEASTSVQVIQAVPHTSIAQPIVLQTIPTTGIQNFQTQVPVTAQDAVFRDRNSSFYNAVPTALQNFLPPNLPYNFYNIANVGDSDLIQHR